MVGGGRGAWVRLPLPHKNLSSGRLYKDSHCGFHPHIRRQMPNLCKYTILCLSIFTDGLHLFLAELLCPFNIWPVRISPSRGQLPLKIPEVCLSFFDPISQTKSRSTIFPSFLQPLPPKKRCRWMICNFVWNFFSGLVVLSIIGNTLAIHKLVSKRMRKWNEFQHPIILTNKGHQKNA